jgi:hypothetical protein
VRAHVGQRAVRVSTASFRLRLDHSFRLLQPTLLRQDILLNFPHTASAARSLAVLRRSRLLKNAVRHARHRARTRRLLGSALLRLCLVASRERVAGGGAPGLWLSALLPTRRCPALRSPATALHKLSLPPRSPGSQG